jgi:hypothetical protein
VSGWTQQQPTRSEQWSWPRPTRQPARRDARRGPRSWALVTAADSSDAESLRDLVLAWAGEDPELLRELVRWESEHRGVLESRDDSVTNTISGNATIHGSVIQARDVSGTFNFGGPS